MENLHTLPAFHPMYQVYVFQHPNEWRKVFESGTEHGALQIRDQNREMGNLTEAIKWTPTVLGENLPAIIETPRKSRKEIAE